MTKDNKDTITKEGKVIELLPSANFRVEMGDGNVIRARISGKMRKNSIRVLMGDSVTVELSTYDLSKGRIIRRDK